jgi:hypothetical protein
MISFFVFWVEVGLFNCNPGLRGTQEPSLRDALNSGLVSVDSGLQLNLEIALYGVSARNQPLRLIQAVPKAS